MKASSWAHPRSRGENGTRSDLAYVSEGSSPLTRGKLALSQVDEKAPGLIPAHAGKTPMDSKALDNLPGSSPLTRGKQSCDAMSAKVSRLIPAHAGKTGHDDP